MRRLLTTLLALSLLTAACGDDDDAAEAGDAPADDAADDVADDADDDAGDAPAADGGGGTAVAIVDFAFDPGTVEVAVGETVTWTNEDGVDHTVTAGVSGDPTEAFDEAIEADGSAEVAFDEAGTFDYFCAIHPTMTGQVVVS